MELHKEVMFKGKTATGKGHKWYCFTCSAGTRENVWPQAKKHYDDNFKPDSAHEVHVWIEDAEPVKK